MRWKILCRSRDGGEKSNAVMDKINKSSQTVITKLTQGVEEMREGWREMEDGVNSPVWPCIPAVCSVWKELKGIISIFYLKYVKLKSPWWGMREQREITCNSGFDSIFKESVRPAAGMKRSSEALNRNYFHFETLFRAVTRKVEAAIKPHFLFYDLTP